MRAVRAVRAVRAGRRPASRAGFGGGAAPRFAAMPRVFFT